MWKKIVVSFAISLCLLGFVSNEVFAEPMYEGEVFQGHRYAVIDEGMAWDEAQKYCEKLGGHLAYIKSEEVQVFLENLLMMTGTKNSYWLGGEQSLVHGDKWKWLDGTPIEGFTKWAYMQPDNLHETKLMMYRNVNLASKNTKLGEWNDLKRDGTYENEVFFGVHNFGLICEWDHP